MSGAPPPPPPPPPPPAPTSEESKSGEGETDMASALFAEINALGDGVRANLKRAVRGPVDDGDDDSTTPEQPTTTKTEVAPTPKKSTVAHGDPVCELVGKKWSVENQVDRSDIEIQVTSMKHTVYVYRCEKSTIQVKGKVNTISIDSCKKVDLVFEDALSQVEVLNCDSVRVQCTGKAPSINIDGCTSVTYFLSEQSVDSAMIITSKSAAINIIRPHPEDPDDIIETPIPEQFCTTLKDGQFVTTAVEHDD